MVVIRGQVELLLSKIEVGVEVEVEVELAHFDVETLASICGAGGQF